MTIEFTQRFKKIGGEITVKDTLDFKDDVMVAWWYSGFYKNLRARSLPHVLVHFRHYIAPGQFGDIVQRRIPLTSLGQVRMGTVWKHDRCRGEMIADPVKFSVNFNNTGWRFTSLAQARLDRSAPPFPMSVYPLQRENDANWLIEFDLREGGKLLVPCIEFFARCYGRSSELKRIIATYPWDNVPDSAVDKLYAPLGEPEAPPDWKVRLRRRMLNSDVIFLAHAKYDPYTTRTAKQINAQLEKHFDPKEKKPAFIQIAPWFEGPAELLVKGFRFNGGKSFFAINVVGMSDPLGEQIHRGRENSNKADAPAPEGSPEAWVGAPERILNNNQIVDLTGDGEPDGDAPSIIIQDPDFVILGNARPVVDIRVPQAKTTAGMHGKASKASMFSAGEPHGSDKEIGHATIYAPQTYESNGILHDMWEAMANLHRKRPDFIQSLAWFSFDDGFSFSPDYKLISLSPFEKDENVDSRARRFTYLEPPKPAARGFLVARLILEDGPIYIIELQRKPKLVKDKDGKVKNGEDPFQGMVFRLEKETQLIPWLQLFKSQIRYAFGVVRRLTGECPGEAKSFSHRAPGTLKTDCLPCESLVLHALGKITKRF